ncbi:MAG: ScpA family protein [Alphaproteobacteria bacterium]
MKREDSELDFSAAGEAAEDGQALVVDIDGFEGPLHLLLALARNQKVDLLKLSVLKLAEQYLAFIQTARSLRFSLAADYLVMAAWLTYLKSRLMLPKPDKASGDEAPAEEIAAQLAFRLARLDAIRKAAEALKDRPQLKRDVFPRGDPQAVKIVSSSRFEGNLFALVQAYSGQVKREAARHYQPATPRVYALDDAREQLRGALPRLREWTALGRLAPAPSEGSPSRASFMASTLSAGLELVKEGSLEAQQLEHFAEIYLRARMLEAAE